MLNIAFLSGGTGTPKLLQGFRQLVGDSELGVICNTGDDLTWYGLHISPDLDTILYLFGEKLDTEKFWGVKDEQFDTLQTLQNLGDDTWFHVGNKDLGLHLFRTQMLREGSLTSFTQKVCTSWGITAQILPMCNQPLQSYIETDRGMLTFQEYFVKHQWKPAVSRVLFRGDPSQTTSEVLNLLTNTDQLIIGPSNPITSIGPILAIEPLRQKIREIRRKSLAISPIVGNSAFSGPSAILMQANGIETSVEGLARHYQEYISKLVIDPADKESKTAIEDLGIEAIILPIELKTRDQKKELANELLNLI